MSALLEVENLSISFRTARGTVRALSGASFSLERGGLLVLAGESGSGKSVLAQSLLGLLPANASVQGAARLGEDELVGAPEKAMRRIRGSRISFIPQSPGAALSPVRRLGPQLMEAARARGLSKPASGKKLKTLLAELDLDYNGLRNSYIHQLSGGMQQRLLNALSLVGEPELVIADEPTSGLDADLREAVAGQLEGILSRGAGLIVITHDLRLARRLGERLANEGYQNAQPQLALLYASRIVERRPLSEFFELPAHPYGEDLLNALPEAGAKPVAGLPPELTDLPEYCAFAPRCRRRFSRCEREIPADYPLADGGLAACFLHDHDSSDQGPREEPC